MLTRMVRKLLSFLVFGTQVMDYDLKEFGSGPLNINIRVEFTF